MSHENVEILRQALEAWNQRDPDRLRSYLAPDLEWEPAGPGAVEAAVWRGPDELIDAAAGMWDTWDVFRFEETEIRDLGDSVLWLGHVHTKGHASHMDLEQEFAILCRVRGDKIVRAKAFRAWQEALEAAGPRD